MARVAIVFTGGTISMRPDPLAGGNTPALDGQAILALAPQVAELAAVEVVDWALVPASHLRFAHLIEIASLVGSRLLRPDVDGAVVVQGTDSIEETAFAHQLLLGPEKPVIVTGAMRDSTSSDYDGPANLTAAVSCATSEALAGKGVQVVLDGLIVAADDVVKTHTSALDTFQSRAGRPTGHVRDGVVRLASDSRSQPYLRRLPKDAVEDVHLITAVTGMDGTLVRLLRPQRPAGLIVAATGSGNTSADLLAAASELIAAGTMVALTTRCPTGAVSPTYAFPGGGATWQRAGAMLSAYDGPKSRVALALGLAAGLDRTELAALLAGQSV